MLKMLKSVPILATVMSAGLMSGQAARADHVDVDIDRLEAEIRQDTHGWRVFVDYQIEIEDAPRYDRFELLLTFSERGRPLVDRLGRPIEVAIPLVDPTDIDDDELEFRDGLTINLPHGVLHNPKRLKIHAEVVSVAQGRVMDRKAKRVKYRRSILRPLRPFRPIGPFRPICPPHPWLRR